MKRTARFKRAFLPFLSAAVLGISSISIADIDENFESGFPPAGWIPAGSYWSTEQSNSATHSVAFNALGTTLTTPALTDPYYLSFYLMGTGGSLAVSYGTTAGGPWTAVSGSPFSASTSGFASRSASLPGGEPLYVQFAGSGSGLQYLDDVYILDSSVATPTPTPSPSDAGYPFNVDDVERNVITNDSGPFNSGFLYDIVEVISSIGNGKRFFIDDLTSHTLSCNAGLLGDYRTTVEGAGIGAGARCTILDADQVWPKAQGEFGTCTKSNSNTLLNTSGTTEWVSDSLVNYYVYLKGYAGSEMIASFFTITDNAASQFTVDTESGGLPAYTGNVSYMIVTNPAKVRTMPQVLLWTDHILDPACASCVRIGLSFRLIPVSNGTGWNPNNMVDPYVAVLLPSGQLYFYHMGSWHVNVRSVFPGFIIGYDFTGSLGVFLMGPGLPSGRYTVYGLLVAPGASVWDQRYWRGSLASTEFDYYPGKW